MRFLITAIGSMSADAVITSLRGNFPKCEIFGTNIYPKEWLYLANKVDVFYTVPKAVEGGYVHSIIDIIRANKIDVIIPLTDPEVDVLSERRNDIEAFSAKLALCKNEVIEICRDKERLYKYFANNPRVDTVQSYSINDALKVELNYPIVAKPKKGRSSEGLKYITSRKDFLMLDDSYIIQEFIQGSVVTVDFVRDYWGNLVCVPRQELIRTVNGAGLSVEIYRDRVVEKQVAEIAKELDIYGCMNVEFIHHHNSYYLIDINPRFSAGIGFSTLAGYDFVRNHINVFSGNKIEPISQIVVGIAAKHQTEYMLGKGKTIVIG